MEAEGVKVNADFIEDFGVELKEKLRLLENDIYTRAGKEFNINSPMQLGNILFEDMKLPFYGKD